MYYCDDLEMQAIERVLKSKKLFRYQGKDVETECTIFEKKFASYLSTAQTLLVSSGTNALVNALFCLGVQEGDEVLIPAYTFFATASAVLELRATPVVVNINESLSYDMEDLQRKVTSKTKVLIAVHMDGYPADMNALIQFCQSRSISLVEDVAQAAGGSYQHKKLGTFGTFGCFSFNVDKIISCGEGGALSINDQSLFQKAFLYHDGCNQFGASSKEFYTIEKFPGKSMRVSEIQGAMINVQLDRLDSILFNLRERKKILDEHLISIGFQLIPTFDAAGECATTSRVLCSDPHRVNTLVVQINELGIKTNSPLLRPAHHVWAWQSLLNSPLSKNKFDYLGSIELLSRVLLIHINLELNPVEWMARIKSIKA